MAIVLDGDFAVDNFHRAMAHVTRSGSNPPPPTPPPPPWLKNIDAPDWATNDNLGWTDIGLPYTETYDGTGTPGNVVDLFSNPTANAYNGWIPAAAGFANLSPYGEIRSDFDMSHGGPAGSAAAISTLLAISDGTNGYAIICNQNAGSRLVALLKLDGGITILGIVSPALPVEVIGLHLTVRPAAGGGSLVDGLVKTSASGGNYVAGLFGPAVNDPFVAPPSFPIFQYGATSSSPAAVAGDQIKVHTMDSTLGAVPLP